MACLREERLTEAEAKLQRLQSVGAKVAHELKNPLASIKGLCQLVARTPESERTQERLAVVASEISRMETILSEYLSFSRPLEDLEPEAARPRRRSRRDVIDVLAGRAEQAERGARARRRRDARAGRSAAPQGGADQPRRERDRGDAERRQRVGSRVRNGGATSTIEVERHRPRHRPGRVIEPARHVVLHDAPERHGPRRRARAGRDRAARRHARLREHGRPRHDRDDHAARRAGGRARDRRRAPR